MIQQTKGMKLPKNCPAPERPKVGHNRAKKQKPDFAEIENVDVEEAKTLLLRLRPDLRSAVNNRTLTEASRAIENRLFPFSGESWQCEPVDGMQLTGLSQGLFVAIDDRRGVIPYEELAQDLLDTADIDDDEAETALDSNGPPVTDPQAIAGERYNGPKSLDAKLADVEVNPFQPRHDFDAAALETLGKSIRSEGLLHPLLLRPKPQAAGKFQIVDGERRWRAAKAAGIHTLPAIVRETSDEQMATLALTANLERQNLSAIEEAHQFRRLIDQFGYTQDRIAKSFRQTPGQISNRLRLLELPREWQARVISQEMGPTHARAIVPYAKHPAILKGLAQALKEEPGMSVAQWDEAIAEEVQRNSRPLSGYFSYEGGKQRNQGNVAFKPTDAQRAELQVVEVSRYGRKETRCLNVKLWNELQTAAVERKAEREDKAAAKGKLTTPKGGNKPVKKKSASDIAAAYQKRLQAWKTNWLRFLCSREMVAPSMVDPEIICSYVPLKMLLWLTCEQTVDYADGFAHRGHFHDRGRVLAGILDGAAKKKKAWDRVDVWRLLSSHGDGGFFTAACKLIASLLYDEQEGPRNHFPADVVVGLAEDLSIDLAKEWPAIDRSRLSDYLGLHGKEQLAKLAKELKVSIDDAKPKSQIVLALLEAAATRKRLPAELAKVKGGKRV